MRKKKNEVKRERKETEIYRKELKNSRKLGKVNEWERSIGKRKNEIIERRKKWKRLNEGIKYQQKMRKNWKNKIFKNENTKEEKSTNRAAWRNKKI